jgi:hypothetical protein
MSKQNIPNDASAKSKAEGDRWESDPQTIERADEMAENRNQGGGITNRPIGEEADNQASLPERGKVRDGAHAGRGKSKEEHKR